MEKKLFYSLWALRELQGLAPQKATITSRDNGKETTIVIIVTIFGLYRG